MDDMPSSLLKRRMFSFGGNKVESVVRSSGWPSSEDVSDEDASFDVHRGLEDKGSAVKREGTRGGVKGVKTQAKDDNDDDGLLIKAMREDGDVGGHEHDSVWLTDGIILDDSQQHVLLDASSEAVNVLPSIAALMEETLLTDTNTESMIRLVRQLHEEDEEIDLSLLRDDDVYDVPRAVDTHGLLKAATASKLADFEQELEEISKVLHDVLSKRASDDTMEERLALLERRVGKLDVAVTMSVTDQEKRVCILGSMIETLRDDLEKVLKMYRMGICQNGNDDVSRRLRALEAGIIREKGDVSRQTNNVKDVILYLLKNVGVPLLTVLLTQRHASRKT